MKNELKAKLVKRLQRSLGGPNRIDAEGLKHILIDIRDLLELTGDDARYQTLKFHCDWILHPTITNSRARKIIKAVDTECVRAMQRRGMQEWPDDIDSHFLGSVSADFIGRLLERFTFNAFESEFRALVERRMSGKSLKFEI